MRKKRKIVLAYSGGLDTSVILRWLQETYHCEVVTFTADIGQGKENSKKYLQENKDVSEKIESEILKSYS